MKAQRRMGKLVRWLEAYAPTVPGSFPWFHGRARRSEPPRLFMGPGATPGR